MNPQPIRVNENYAQLFGKGPYRVCEAYRDFRAVIAGCGMVLRVVTAAGKEVPGLRFDPQAAAK